MAKTPAVHNIAKLFGLSTAAKKKGSSVRGIASLGPLALFGTLLMLLALPSSTGAQWNALNPVKDIRRTADSVELTMNVGTLRIQIASESTVHVTYWVSSAQPQATPYMVTKTSWPPAQWSMQSTDKDVTISTAKLPPSRWPATILPNTTFASVTVGSKPPRP